MVPSKSKDRMWYDVMQPNTRAAGHRKRETRIMTILNVETALPGSLAMGSKEA